MELHRVGKKADWAKLVPRKWNAWQRLAAGTGGVITIGNALTVIGFSLVITGLALVVVEQYWGGLALMFAGRCCDLLDGWLANLTGTKSPLGEIFDATADKLETAAAVVVLVVAGLVPWWLALVVVLPHAVISLVAVIAWWRSRTLHPSRLGKISMAVAWAGLGSFVLMRALDLDPSGLVAGAAYAVCALSAGMGAYVVRDYARVFRRSPQKSQ